MTRKEPANLGASVRARLLRVSKERQEDVTRTLMNYGAERFLYRLANSAHRNHFVLQLQFAPNVDGQDGLKFAAIW